MPPKNDPPQKRSKLNPKSKEQIEILEKEFLNCNYLNDKSLNNLINVAGLKKAQIQDWFSRKRRKSSSNKENIQPAKIFIGFAVVFHHNALCARHTLPLHYSKIS